MEELYNDFIDKLKELFGDFNEENKRFDSISNSNVARKLGYSDAQFSRLINFSATEKEYQRAIQNTERIITIIKLKKELEEKGTVPNDSPKKPLWKITSGILAISLLVILVFIGTYQGETKVVSPPRDAMLQWSFENSFVNPYTKLDDLPDDCNYPCYKYQGQWGLDSQYKIPFYIESNGFHYQATEVNMYTRCMSEKSSDGSVLEGYEYQKHEIWYDKRQLPINSFINNGNSNLKHSYESLDFTTDDNFVKVAVVHTFFRNEFKITDSLIYRTGKVLGRDLEFTPKSELEKRIKNNAIIKHIKNELNLIATKHLEDFSKPISCNASKVANPDFNAVKDGDKMSFNCTLTTSKVAMNYSKTFVLKNQYIKSTCRQQSPKKEN